MFTGEWAAGLVRVDNQGVRQAVAGQVMVGNQHFNAAPLRLGDAGKAGDAVVDRDQRLRLPLRGQFNDFRCQPVAVFETVGDNEMTMAPGMSAMRAHADCAGGGAVGVVIGDVSSRSRRWMASARSAGLQR